MNGPKSIIIISIFTLALSAALAGTVPALAGSMTLYETSAGSTIEIGGRGLSFTNVPDGVTHVMAGPAVGMPARYGRPPGADLEAPALEVRFLDAKGKPVGIISALVYVYFNLDPAGRRLWDRDSAGGVSLWYASEQTGGWQPCPAYFVEAGAHGRLACLAPGSGYYALGRSADVPTSASGSAGSAGVRCDMPAGLKSWYYGNWGVDSFAGGPRGDLVGGASIGAGKFHVAFVLDGDGDYVDVPHDPLLDLTGDFTISLWVEFNTIDGEQVLIEKYVQGDGFVDGWTLTKLENQAIRFAMENVEGAHVNLDTPELALLPGEWVHFAAVRRSAAITIFVNGMPLAHTPRMGALDMSTEASLKLGHRGDPDDTPGSSDASGFYLNGRIDEVQIWNGTGLSEAEIRRLYDQPECLCRPGIFAGAQPAGGGHRIYVQLHDGGIRYEYAAPGSWVTFSIYAGPGGDLFWSQGRCADASGFATVAGSDHPVEFAPGTYVVVSDGVRTKDFVIELVTIDVRNLEENVVAGTAPAGLVVLIGIGDENGRCEVHILTDIDGEWSIDFDEQGCDLAEGTPVYAQVFDADFDTSEVFWQSEETPSFK